jgi:hypothetical protein
MQSITPPNAKGAIVQSARKLPFNYSHPSSARKCNNCLNIPSRITTPFPRESFQITTRKHSNQRAFTGVSGRTTPSMAKASSFSKKAPTTRAASGQDRPPSREGTSSTTAASTREKSTATKRREKAPTSTPFKITSIRAGGRRTSPTDGDGRSSETAHTTRASFRTASKRGTGTTSASREYTKASFQREILAVRERSATLKAGRTKASGLRDSSQAMGSSPGLTEIAIRDNTTRA